MNESLISRRSLLQSTGVLLAGSFASPTLLSHFAGSGQKPLVTAGLITDVHHAEVDTRGTRFYRDSMGKLKLAVAEWRKQKVDFAVETGDFVDAPAETTAAIELGYLKAIDAEFKKAARRTHYVLGNHCVNAMSKEAFLGEVKQASSYYSWDQGGWHWVVLDACYRKDGVSYEPGNFKWTDTEINGAQREWLRADLERADAPTVVFVHQRLDLPQGDNYAIWSSEEVRKILETSGKVVAVVMGHSHKNFLTEIKGIHYLVTAATVEGAGMVNAGYSVLRGFPGGVLEFEGFVTHKDHPFKKSKGLAVSR